MDVPAETRGQQPWVVFPRSQPLNFETWFLTDLGLIKYARMTEAGALLCGQPGLLVSFRAEWATVSENQTDRTEG